MLSHWAGVLSFDFLTFLLFDPIYNGNAGKQLGADDSLMTSSLLLPTVYSFSPHVEHLIPR